MPKFINGVYIPIAKQENQNNEKMKESSISRLLTHNEAHDCGAITAFRKGEACGEGKLYSKAENKARNKSLLAKLMSLGYQVTQVKGIYPEGGFSKKEESFFVVDANDTGHLEQDLFDLGEEFEQDSVLVMPKGSLNNKAKAFLLGTNHCPKGFPGYEKKFYFDKASLGKESAIYTSKVNNRPFIFEGVDRDIPRPASGFGLWGMHASAKKPWRHFVEDADFKKEQAYWISPRGNIIGFTYSIHIKKVIESPETFGYTEEKLRAWFDKHNEPYGSEGYAREEILKDLIRKGWIRIRQYRNFWSANLGSWNTKTKDLLKSFCEEAIKAGISPFEEIRIDSPGRELTVTSFKKVAEDYLYMIEKTDPKSKRYRIKFVEKVQDL